MGTFYISIILLCRFAQHLFTKRTSNQIEGLKCFFKYGAFRNILSGLLGLLLILITGAGLSADLPTLLISLFSGLMIAASTGFELVVLKSGTVALSSLFGTAGLLIPCVAGIFLFDKPMSVGQFIGLFLFFVAAYFLISSSSKIYNGFSFKTFLLLLGVMLSNGFTMLAQQMFASYIPNGNVSVFSFLSFSTVGVIMLLASFFIPQSKKNSESSRLTPQLLGFGAILSVAVFIINQLATMAAATISPVILFTFINGGSTIIGAIVAAAVFKEKLTVKSVVGILLGIISLVVIKAL